MRLHIPRVRIGVLSNYDGCSVEIMLVPDSDTSTGGSIWGYPVCCEHVVVFSILRGAFYSGFYLGIFTIGIVKEVLPVGDPVCFYCI
jgi:hypothetical protein